MSTTHHPEALNLEEFRAKVTHAAREPLLARIADLEAQLSDIGAGGVEPLRKQAAAPQAVQAAVPVAHRHEFTDGHRTLKQDVFSAIHDYAATKPEQDPDDPESWESWFEAAFDLLGTRVGQIFEEHAERSAPAHPAEGVPAQAVELEVDDLIDRLLDAQQDLNLAANVHMDQSIASASTLLDEVEIALRTLAATHPTQQGLEKDAEAIRTAVLSCGHTIERDFVTLWFEEKKEGHNALNQLGRRISAALAAQAKQGE